MLAFLPGSGCRPSRPT